MTMPRDFTKNTGWGRADNNKYPSKLFASPLNTHLRTSSLQLPSKKLNPLQAPLFDLLTTAILKDIEILVSGLKYCEKFNPVVLGFKTICNPIFFAIPHDLWNPYHNVGVFHWYNEEHYKWVHRRIFAKQTDPWTCYKYYAKKSTYITQLTPEFVQSLKSSKTIQKIA